MLHKNCIALALASTALLPGAVHAVSLAEVIQGKRGFTIDGDRPYYRIGVNVAGGGDVNGDGLDDILIGEKPYVYRDVPGAHYGTAYVVFGRTDTMRVNLAEIRAGIGGFTIHAEALDDELGDVIKNAGDVNGDGLADILVAEQYADPFGRADAGSVYVIFGKSDTAPVQIAEVAAGIGGFPIHGRTSLERAGFSFDGIGDINGDGFDDIRVEADPLTYIVFGSQAPATMDLATLANSSRGFVVGGAARPAGISAPALGDINGDGKDDFIASAAGLGGVAVIYGKADTDEVDVADLGPGGFLVRALMTSMPAVDTAGDMNNDGRSDLVFSAHGNAYVIFGSQYFGTITLQSTALQGASGFVVRNDDIRRHFGTSLAGVGDQNNDGRGDFIVGAPGSSLVPGASGVGAPGVAYLVYGKPTLSTIRYESIVSGPSGYALVGVSHRDLTGLSTSSGGDINGDGISDFIISAPDSSPNRQTEAGGVYVVFGGPLVFPDSDGDGASDTMETNTGRLTNPWNTGSSPNNSDSDGDWIPDGVELAGRADPNNPLSIPGFRPHEIAFDQIAAGRGGFVINGVNADDMAGIVSGAGDVNGDGLPDIIVGAPGSRAFNFSNAGNVYVVFGKRNPLPVNLSAINFGHGFAIRGANNHDAMGVRVSGLGDFNGDGLADIGMMTAKTDLDTSVDAGALFIALGKASFSPVDATQLSAGHGGLVIRRGAQYIADNGISGAGDVNGDGRADVVISRRGATHQALVVFGRTSTASIDLDTIAAGIGGFVVAGAGESDGIGWSIAGAGDINGDGLDDIVIGGIGSFASELGQAAVVFGRTETTPIPLDDVRTGVGGFVIEDDELYTSFGTGVGGVGDVNADGLDDIAIGGGGASQDYATFAGVCYVVFGKQNTASVAAVDIENGIGGFVIRSAKPSNVIGELPPVPAGDVNNDGFDDILLGTTASARDDLPSAAGQAFVVFGKADTDPVSLLAVEYGTGGLYIPGTTFMHLLGLSASGIGDLNGDGFDDIVVGAPGDPEYSNLPGHSYIIHGFAPPPPDSDGDLIPDHHETNTGTYTDPEHTGTNPHQLDSDGDGIPDGVETGLGTDPNDPLDFPDGLPLEGAHLAFFALVVSALLVLLGFGQSRRSGP